MTQAASMCLRQDPESRPPVSKIVRVLEGGDPTTALGLDLDSVGCRSGHLRGLPSSARIEAKRTHSRTVTLKTSTLVFYTASFYKFLEISGPCFGYLCRRRRRSRRTAPSLHRKQRTAVAS